MISSSSIPTSICVRFRTETILFSRIRYFDVFILIPNILFFLFLTQKWYRSRKKKIFGKPLVLSVITLIMIVTLTSIIRCILSMIFVHPNIFIQNVIIKIMWLLLRFTLLCTEFSVLLFGLCYVRYNPNNQWSCTIKIICLSIIFSLCYAIAQGFFEFYQNARPNGFTSTHNLYAYGGLKFLLTSSSVFLIIYTIIFFLPYLCQKYRKYLPIRRSFYYYCLVLACFSLVQVIGTILNLTGVITYGICFVDVTTILYYILFGPFVYFQFLHRVLTTKMNVPQVTYTGDSIEGEEHDDEDYYGNDSLPTSRYNQIQSNKRYFDSIQSTIVDSSYNKDDDVSYSPTTTLSSNNVIIV